MTRNIFISHAHHDDFEPSCGLYEELDEHHRRALPQVFRVPRGPRRDPALIFALIDGPDSTILVAESRESLLGFATVAMRHAPESAVREGRCYGEIDSLSVRADCRRQGIAKNLLKASSEWSYRRGATTIELNVWDFNEGAGAFYEAFGFEASYKRMTYPIIR